MGGVLSIAIDENRKQVVVGYSSGQVGLWNFQENRFLKPFPLKFNWLTNLGFLKNGKVYLLRTYSNRVWVWDPLDNRELLTELDHSDEVWSLSLDQQSQKLVSLGDDNKIKLWDLQAKTEKTIGHSDTLLTRGRFSEDGTLFAACDFSGFIQVWETSEWNLIKKIRVTQNKLRSLAWGKTNDFLVCVGNGTAILEVNLKNDSVKNYQVSSNCSDILYSQNYDEFIVAVQDPLQLNFYQFPGGQLKHQTTYSRSPTRMAIDSNSQRVAVGYDDGGFAVVSLKDHAIERNVGTEQSDGSVIDLIFSPDGRNVITSVKGGRALIYDTVTWEKIGSIDSHLSDIHAFAFSPDAGKLATGDMSGKIKILHLPENP
ncbi:MAG: WD40 repeat domain-containing protein [bacterium]